MEHISDDDLVLYSLGMMRNVESLAPLEEHLLWCHECLDRAEIHSRTWLTLAGDIVPNATAMQTSSAFQSMCFNPRARVRRDATMVALRFIVLWFQSTCPFGARHLPVRSLSVALKFQSTRPFGARRR